MRRQGFAIGHYGFTLGALPLKPSIFCNIGVNKTASRPNTARCGALGKFYSKNGNNPPGEKSISKIIKNLSRYGPEKVQRFESWVQMFEN